MANFNKVLLMGNLTRDPELRYGGGGGAGQGGSAICKLGLAVNRQWRDQAGQQQEEVTYVDITVFGRQAETCNEYLRKGRPVFVEGRLHYHQWEDRESGAKRSKLDVVAERVQFLGSPGGGGGGGGPREPAGDAEGAGESGGGGGGGFAPRTPRAAPSGGTGPGGGPGGRGGPPAGGSPPAGGGGKPAGGEGVDFTDDIPS